MQRRKTKAAVERTRQLVQQAEAHGETLEDPLLLFSVLNSLWTASIVSFNGEEACELAAEFLVGTLMHTLSWTILVQILSGDYVTASWLINELVTLADDKGTSFWKAWGMMSKGLLLALTGKVLDAVHASTSGIAAWRLTGATMCLSYYSSCLAMSYAELGHFDDARCLIRKAIRTIEETKERWFEAEIYRMAGEIELKSLDLGGERAEAYFARALSIARVQQAKSFELRAAMSMARLWSGQAKRDEARNLLTPSYSWFTEGFDTLDLKAAKVLLDDLAR
jgi:predicted ATPase